MASSGVVVKNTFLEVGDHASLLERSDMWRRQMSEPANMVSGEMFLAAESCLAQERVQEERQSEGDEAEDDNGPQLGFFELAEGRMPAGSSSTAGRGAAPASKPVLLLSESIPPRRSTSDKEQQQQQQREKRSEARTKDSIINRMKNNDITQREPPWTDVTTVMMRNLPNKYTQQMLLEELQDSGFRLQSDFDFFYLPMDHSNAANLGYCFINFVETAMANAFAAAFQGKKMRRFNSNKTVVVMPASIQGYDRNYAYYSSTRVAQAEDPQYRPLFMRHINTSGQGSFQGQAGTAAGKALGGKNRGGKLGKAMSKAKGDGPGQPPSQDPVIGSAAPYSDWPGMTGLASGWQPPPSPAVAQAQPQPQPRICGNCSNECSSAHRFCAFCGSFIGHSGAEHASKSTPGVAFGMNSGMRADAPSFTPNVGGGSSSGRRDNRSAQQQRLPASRRPGPPMLAEVQDRPLPLSSSLQASLGIGSPLGGTSPLGDAVPPPPPAALGGRQYDIGGARDAAGAASPLGALPAFQYPDSITDELDVMRGRMMLLAALKDMEKREGGTSATRAVDAVAQEGILGVRGDPGGPQGLPTQALRW